MPAAEKTLATWHFGLPSALSRHGLIQSYSCHERPQWAAPHRLPVASIVERNDTCSRTWFLAELLHSKFPKNTKTRHTFEIRVS